MNKSLVLKNLLVSYSEQAGDGAQTLLFLHGWRSNKEIWNNAMVQLSIVNCKLFSIDLPGFGDSQAPTTPSRMHSPPLLGKEGNAAGWTVGDYADVVAEFIRKLELKNVIIVGHSFGGRVAIKLAAKYPSEVQKLVLVDSAGFPIDAAKKSLYKTAAKIVKPFFKPGFMQPLRKKIYQKIGAEDYLATPELQKTFVNVTSEDLSEDMKKIQVPTLMIYGQNDKDTPITYGELMKFLIPNSKLVILPNAGHFSFLDKPAEFVEAVKSFISDR